MNSYENMEGKVNTALFNANKAQQTATDTEAYLNKIKLGLENVTNQCEANSETLDDMAIEMMPMLLEQVEALAITVDEILTTVIPSLMGAE